MRRWGDGSKPKTCTIDDCDKPVVSLGLCNAHYKLSLEIEKSVKKHGTLTPIGKNGHPKGGPGSGSGKGGGGAFKLTNDEATIKRIRDLAGLQCTKQEIAGVLQVGRDTFISFLDRYPEADQAYEDGKLNGRASLRRMQFVQAKRSAAMGIHLGKNYLDQYDGKRDRPAAVDAGYLYTGDPASEEAPSALLRAVRAEIE
jgi:hypothetical protein